jgi:cobyrinic acid a,c-diamide synthase
MHASNKLSAIVVAGTSSGVGKTTVTLGLIAALRRRGLTVQPFKVGPDFIDPLHHSRTAGRPSRNLDGWMLDQQTNRQLFARHTTDADAAVIEGVMGVFDGSTGGSEAGSTAEMAKWLDTPCLLVIDAGAMARSAAALIHGYATYDPQLRLAGAVLNNVGGQAHADMIRDAVAGQTPILGAIPRTPGLTMPERHLGLHLPEETPLDLEALAELVEQHLDLDALLAQSTVERIAAEPTSPAPPVRARIGIARDEAFCFYYQDNLDLLQQAGAELVEFSPLRDPLPDNLNGLYLGGGYPELHAAQLSANTPTRDAIREFAESGQPIYAECGGLMYLAEELHLDGERHPLCGVLPFSTRMPAPLKLAYTEITTTGGLFGTGHTARGHLYHHSEIIGEPSLPQTYELRTTRGETATEGYSNGNVLASYIHLHFASHPALAERLVTASAPRQDAQPNA